MDDRKGGESHSNRRKNDDKRKEGDRGVLPIFWSDQFFGIVTVARKSRSLNLLSVDGFVKSVKRAINLDLAEYKLKPYMKTIAKEAMLTIPTTGSGFLAKKTVVTTGKGATPPTRKQTAATRRRLGRRRTGNSATDQQKAISTAMTKIDRMKNERLAFLLGKKDQDLTLMRLNFGAYYYLFVSPRYDGARRKLPKVVKARLKSRNIRN